MPEKFPAPNPEPKLKKFNKLIAIGTLLATSGLWENSLFAQGRTKPTRQTEPTEKLNSPENQKLSALMDQYSKKASGLIDFVKKSKDDSGMTVENFLRTYETMREEVREVRKLIEQKITILQKETSYKTKAGILIAKAGVSLVDSDIKKLDEIIEKIKQKFKE